MSYDVEITTHGKWILAGEHAVLRGHGALVFPIPDKTLCLRYRASTLPLMMMDNDPRDTALSTVVSSLLRHGLSRLGLSMDGLTGELSIDNTIPVGFGMGASAALCVAIARWLAVLNPDKIDPYHAAQQLEHYFHGKSSGLDIVGVAATTGVYFQQGQCTPIVQTWQPSWYLSSSGQTGLTADCIAQVQALWKRAPKRAAVIDEQMHASVLQAHHALSTDSPDSVGLLADAIQLAADCFEQWGLVHPLLHQHMQLLRDYGALAVKVTGSGGGGYVLSLWSTPPTELPIELIPLAEQTPYLPK